MFSLVFWCKERNYSILESKIFKCAPVEGEKRKIKYGKNYYLGKILKIHGKVLTKYLLIISPNIFFIACDNFQDDEEYLESLEVKNDGSISVPSPSHQRQADKMVQTLNQASTIFAKTFNTEPSTSGNLVKNLVESKFLEKKVKNSIFI